MANLKSAKQIFQCDYTGHFDSSHANKLFSITVTLLRYEVYDSRRTPTALVMRAYHYAIMFVFPGMTALLLNVLVLNGFLVGVVLSVNRGKKHNLTPKRLFHQHYCNVIC